MTTEEIQSSILHCHAEDVSEIQMATAQLGCPEEPFKGSSEAQTSNGSVLLPTLPVPGPRVALPSRVIDEDYDTPEVVEILKRRRQRQGKVKPYDRRTDRSRQSKPLDEQYRDILRLHGVNSTITSIKPLSPVNIVPLPRVVADGLSEPGGTEASNGPGLGRPYCASSSSPARSISHHFIQPLSGPPAVGTWQDPIHPRVPAHIPARGKLGCKETLPTNMECFGMRKAVSKLCNRSSIDPRPNRPDPLEGLTTRLGKSTIAGNPQERLNVDALSSSPVTQCLPPTPGNDRIESVVSRLSLRRKLDAQRIQSWNLVYNSEGAVVSVSRKYLSP